MHWCFALVPQISFSFVGLPFFPSASWPLSIMSLFFFFLRPCLIHARMPDRSRAFVHGHTFYLIASYFALIHFGGLEPLVLVVLSRPSFCRGKHWFNYQILSIFISTSILHCFAIRALRRYFEESLRTVLKIKALVCYTRQQKL